VIFTDFLQDVTFLAESVVGIEFIEHTPMPFFLQLPVMIPDLSCNQGYCDTKAGVLLLQCGSVKSPTIPSSRCAGADVVGIHLRDAVG